MASSPSDEKGLLGDDIEKQSSVSPYQSSPITTLATPNLIVPNDNLGDKADTKEESAPNPTSNATTTSVATTADSKAEDVATKVGQFIGFFLCCIVVIIAFPFVLAYMIVSVCLTGSIQWPNECFSSNKNGPSPSLDNKTKGIYGKMQEFETTKEKILELNFVVTTRLGCLALSWLAVNLCVPSLASLTLVGYPLWKWSLLSVIVLLGYPSAALTVVLTTAMIGSYNDEFIKTPNLGYFMEGLEASFTGLLHFALILLMWLLYFRTNRGLNPSTKLDKLGTWTFVSLFVAALLWVLKSAALLEWKAKAVYKRFKGRILTAGFQLYFLQIVTRQSFFRELLPWRAHEEQDSSKSSSDEKSVEATINNNNNDNEKIVTDDNKSLHISLSNLSEKVTTEQINYVAGMITRLAQVTQREDDGIPEVVAQYEEKISSNFGSTGLKKENIEKYFGLNENEVYLLLKELGAEQLSDEITRDAFRKWMVDAHKNCLSVGYTLIDAFAMVSILNKVIIGFLAVMVILTWLLVTELATTKVLVLVASPILALSFVFGDTCKTFFQGVIFAFVTHPYDVGDRCIIDGMELEVKRISILTTTFLRIGTKEKMLYPHSSLATKLITNLEGEPDPNDMIELMLDSSTTMSKILDLKQDLESFFKSNDDRHGSFEKDLHVTLKEIGNNIKVMISFTHVMNVQDVSHSQCLQKKNKQRSELLIKVKQFLEKQEIKLATS